MSAAKWHAMRAQDFRDDAGSAERNVRRNDSAEWAETCAREAESCIERAAHHALAATVLDALAVPGVAELLYGLSGDRGYQPTGEQRKALLRLVGVARLEAHDAGRPAKGAR
jgi:hypothetical protein